MSPFIEIVTYLHQQVVEQPNWAAEIYFRVVFLAWSVELMFKELTCAKLFSGVSDLATKMLLFFG